MIVVDRDGPNAVLTMNRPDKRNSLTLDMIVRFADIIASGPVLP